MFTHFIRVVVVCAMPFTGRALLAQAPTNSPDLIVIQRGTLPILLTAPHGGTQPIPGVPNRSEGTVTMDMKTLELATAVSLRLSELLGGKPYLVGAKFQRKFLDVNRAPVEAYQDDKARPVYEEYHGQVRAFVDELRAKYPQGALLLDIHGQAKGTNTIFRGTRNGVTVMRQVQVRGVDSLIGTNSILGRMQKLGYDVFPLNTPPGTPPEDRSYNGGFTVGTYGSHKTNGIDALQCEFGTALRSDETRRNQVAKDFAEAVATFYRAYLTNAPPAK